jgi:hypothetical protein
LITVLLKRRQGDSSEEHHKGGTDFRHLPILAETPDVDVPLKTASMTQRSGM